MPEKTRPKETKKSPAASAGRKAGQAAAAEKKAGPAEPAGHDAPPVRPAPIDPSCSECSTRNCYRRDSQYPKFCLTEENAEGARETKELYLGTSLEARVSKAAAEVECEYYGRLTRVEETIVFALKMGARKLGVASCIALVEESTIYAKAARSAGLDVRTVICKVGSIDKCEIGIPDGRKLIPGAQESCCNPVLQARILDEWGADVSVSIGLCVGHDWLFTKNSQAPAVTLAVKDRVLAHNPLAAIHTSKTFYSRIMDFSKLPKPRK
jgi:uncharacterized metal-binding protein